MITLHSHINFIKHILLRKRTITFNTLDRLLDIQQTELSSTNLKDSGAHMERRVFGIRKVSIQQGWEPEQILNNELWGYEVSPNQFNTTMEIERLVLVRCLILGFLIKCRLAYLGKGIASTHKRDRTMLNGQLSTI